MKKTELVELLDSLSMGAVNEGIQNDVNTNIFPRIVYFEYMWNDIDSSGGLYDTLVTYQVSFFDTKPRSEKLLELKEKLNKVGIKPRISHEYLDDLKCIHSWFTLDVIEEL